MTTTYNGYEIVTTFENGQAVHIVNGKQFSSMMAAMNYVDTLQKLAAR